mmetsp:Transcript_70757/g.121480  ORF Transcript_70757/g.121480 Transcript_70757/m.121480 type:complete len:172 (-) Transcript_70757:226-741(-)
MSLDRSQLLLILALILLRATDAKNSRTKYDRFWRAAKATCERNNCGHLIPEEAMNCVNLCTSPMCFEDIYAEAKGGPLEDGEIDLERKRKFETCLRKEEREKRVSSNREKNKKKMKEGETREERRKRKKAARALVAADEERQSGPEKEEEEEEDANAALEMLARMDYEASR